MLLRNSIARVAIAIALTGAAEYPVQGQHRAPRTIRIGDERADVLSRPALRADLVGVVPPATELEVILLDREWYWVMLPADTYGTRRAGWVHADDVEGAREAMAIAVQQRADKASKRAAEKAAVKAAEKAERAAEKAEKAAEKAAQAAEKAEQAEKAPDTRALDQARRELEKARADYDQVTKPSDTPEKQ
jgi:hypothetical protein